MGLIAAAADTFYSYKFLRLLTTPWNQTDVFRLGIVDENGKTLKSASELKTSEEKSAYSIFNRLVFNVKRTLNALPGGRSRIASYAAALYLLKEETRMSQSGIDGLLENIDPDQKLDLTENTWFLSESGCLQPGTYTLTRDCPFRSTAEFRARAGTRVNLLESTKPAGVVLNVPVFEARHQETGQTVIVTTENLSR